jgi:hypothetical protein
VAQKGACCDTLSILLPLDVVKPNNLIYLITGYPNERQMCDSKKNQIFRAAEILALESERKAHVKECGSLASGCP